MKNNYESIYIHYCGLLGIALTILKLTGIIKWRWVWVLAPIWWPLGIAMLALIIYIIFVLITGVFISIREISDKISTQKYLKDKYEKYEKYNSSVSKEYLKKRDKDRASEITVDYEVIDED